MAFGIIILLLAIQFSYTRTVYVGLVMAIGAYYIIRWRLMKVVLIAATIFVISICSYLVQHNKFLDFTPDFSKTVSHESFDNLIDATYKMQDISTMERVYRWVAAEQNPQRHH